MTNPVILGVDIGPFDQIIAFNAPPNRFRFRFIRADGVHITPDSDAWVEITLYSEFNEWFFTGNSWADPDFGYTEAHDGLIKSFDYRYAHYEIEFNPEILRNIYNQFLYDFKVYLMTDGDKTLETTYPGCYHDSQKPVAMPPATYDVPIPLWHKTTLTSYLDITTTIKNTIMYASVPYAGSYRIRSANAMANFLFPILGVIWSANPSLTGWTYELQLSINCPGIDLYLPDQNIEDLTPPKALPSSPTDQQMAFYYNIILTLGLGECSNVWHAMRLHAETSFGYTGNVPFSEAEVAFLDADFDFPGIFSPSVSGQSFSRAWQLQWNHNWIMYETGYWPVYYSNQVASLVQSPEVDFDSLHFHPEPG